MRAFSDALGNINAPRAGPMPMSEQNATMCCIGIAMLTCSRP